MRCGWHSRRLMLNLLGLTARYCAIKAAAGASAWPQSNRPPSAYLNELDPYLCLVCLTPRDTRKSAVHGSSIDSRAALPPQARSDMAFTIAIYARGVAARSTSRPSRR
jgi:hypothetical protein